jgi:hypothetical protein
LVPQKKEMAHGESNKLDKLIRHKNGKKSIQVETDVKKTKDDIRNDMKKLKIKNWTNCIQHHNNCKLYVVLHAARPTDRGVC